MEPTDNPQMQNQQVENVGTNHRPDLSMPTFFLQQGKSINRLYPLLQSNGVTHGLKNFLSYVLQVFCYLLYATIVIDCIGNYFPFDQQLPASAKLLIAIIALPILLCALLVGVNRRKDALTRAAFNETVEMKKHFDEAMDSFRS